MAKKRTGPDRSAPQFCAFHSDTCIAVTATEGRNGKGQIRTEGIEFVIGDRYHIYKRVPTPTSGDAEMVISILNIMSKMGYNVNQEDVEQAMESLK